MTKADLIEKIAEKAELPKADAEKATNALVESITEALKRGDSIALQGFGTFKVKDRAARKARNPRTGEEINVAASKSAAFSPAPTLKKL
ncbi:MAG TPA: integration host factor subunit alpha [Nitrospiraceae bacterium]|nr:integration host factor subunit alpha [Nitrospiraceae bacterium]